MTQPISEDELQHALDLDIWLDDHLPAKLEKCRAAADRGVAPRNPDCLQYAVSAILSHSLDEPQRSEAMQLLGHYIDTGVVRLDQPLDSQRGPVRDFHRRQPLQEAIMCRHVDGVLLMIRKGALAVTDLRTQRVPGQQHTNAPVAGESVDDAFFRWIDIYFGGERPRALILQAVMDWKLSTVKGTPEIAAVTTASKAPAPRRSRSV